MLSSKASSPCFNTCCLGIPFSVTGLWLEHQHSLIWQDFLSPLIWQIPLFSKVLCKKTAYILY